MTLPSDVEKHLRRWIFRSRSPFCMEVTKDHRLLETWGGAEPYGLEGLEPGDDATELAPFLGDYAASEAVDLPFVTDAAGHAYHIHLIPGGHSRYVLYIDARDELEHQRRHQQTANEVKLLLERERRLIDELVDARTELIVRRKEAEEESRRRGEYIGTMSHEFKTPLTSVLAHAERLAEDAASPEDAQTGRAICRLTQHQLWLIDNLLLRARLEADGVALHRTVTDIRKLVDDLCLVFAPLAADKALSFGARVGHEVAELVLLDDLHFRQVLVNLLGNAVKYTEEGAVELDIQHNGEQLSASVTDTGPGMHRDEQAALFDPFRRGREAPRVAGAGLGLSITRRLVEAMEGELDLDSSVGQGTRVTVRIAAPAAENAPAGALGPGEARLIVLGEDDPDISALLEVRLGEAGYRVHGVTDGEAVVDSALSLRPSLVIVDTNMPKLDGPAAARKLRESGFDAPILALSGASSRQDIDYALSSGCTEFLRKPPHLETLKRLIHRLILTGQTAPTARPPPLATTQTNVTEP